jgi:hypothetical protein
MALFYVTQRIRVVREKSGRYPWIVGAEGHITRIMPGPDGPLHALSLPGVPIPDADAKKMWWAEADEIEPILLPPEELEDEEEEVVA